MHHDAPPIYEDVFTYRRPGMLVLGLAFLVIGGGLSVWFTLLELDTSLPPRQRPGFVVPGFCGLFVLGGAGFLVRFLADTVLRIRIDANGVAYVRRVYPWAKIQSLHGRVEATPIQLVLQRRGWLPLDTFLSTDDGLTDADYENLMRELEKEVAPRFPHLSFWPK
ncbi:MAG: hypothetical protein ACK5TH_25860 [Prosthecobacter sp.]